MYPKQRTYTFETLSFFAAPALTETRLRVGKTYAAGTALLEAFTYVKDKEAPHSKTQNRIIFDLTAFI